MKLGKFLYLYKDDEINKDDTKKQKHKLADQHAINMVYSMVTWREL